MIRTFAPTPRRKPARADKPEMTLDRVLSRAGLASRTEAARLIASGRVQVGGRTLRDPNLWVAPARLAITLDGQPLTSPRRLYWAFHKPSGVLTSHGDPGGRPTIYDVVGKLPTWYFPVGRLDLNTSGLLLLTNDSIFAERVANPEHKITKLYHVLPDAPLPDAALDLLRRGLEIGRGQHTAPARVLRLPGRSPWLEIEIQEGMNRQVRRMLEAVGAQVQQLHRVRIGKLLLGDLPPGKLRRIRPQDVI